MPKGVINTQKMLCVNMQQAQQVRPQDLGETVIVDWLPWNHTMGGNSRNQCLLTERSPEYPLRLPSSLLNISLFLFLLEQTQHHNFQIRM